MHVPRTRVAIVRTVLIAMCFSMAGFAGPSATLADTDLVIGGEAVVAYAQGDNVRVRTGASYGEGVVTSVAEGSTLTVLDGPFADGDGNSWFEVRVNGVTGYMVSDYLANSSGILLSTQGTATATDTVNLRSGPSLGYSSIGKIQTGDVVTLEGSASDGWLMVTWNGYTGWAYGAFLADGGEAAPVAEEPVAEEPVEEEVPVEQEAPAEEEAAIEWIDAGTRYTSDTVNFRSGPSLSDTVYEELVTGTPVELTGRSQNGFAEGTANGYAGWVSLDYLSWDAPAEPEPEPVVEEVEEEEPVEEAPPVSSGSRIIWPMSGGEWKISQGYNGTSHVNSGSLWQYQYSFDLVRSDGSTSGQPTYSPVNGTVRWLDPSTGGISIDIGEGLAVSLFHIDIDGSITEGDSVSQGDYIGTVSGPGGGGNGGFPHIHLTVWATSDGGNWDRQAIPFEGAAAISGQNFPSSGVNQDWTGTIIYP